VSERALGRGELPDRPIPIDLSTHLLFIVAYSKSINVINGAGGEDVEEDEDEDEELLQVSASATAAATG
jgi:hypothetical protein